jgi:hypothetical protein
VKKILSILTIILFILGGFEAFADSINIEIENKPLNLQYFELEIRLNGGFFGYTVSITNIGTEPINGNLTMEINTAAQIVIIGRDHNRKVPIDLVPGNKTGDLLLPLIGFGTATISISCLLEVNGFQYPNEATIGGFGFIIYILTEEAIINLPYYH